LRVRDNEGGGRGGREERGKGARGSAAHRRPLNSLSSSPPPGPIFNDYTTVGYSLLIKKEKAVIVEPDRVVVAGRRFFQCVAADEFMTALAVKVKANETAWINHGRMFVPPGAVVPPPAGAPLQTKVAFQHVQQLINDIPAALVVETG
jgi:pyruvate decarboxylase